MLVMPLVTMIVIVVTRRPRNLRAQVVELCRRAIESEVEAAELDVPGLLGEHDFEKIEVIRLKVEPLHHRRQKNRRAVAGRHVVLGPADVLFNELLEILQIDAPLRQRVAIEPQHVADRRNLNSSRVRGCHRINETEN